MGSRRAQPHPCAACSPFFGALKQSQLSSKEEATRFVNHLITLGALRVATERLEKKAGQQFTPSRSSLLAGDKAAQVLSGALPVKFAIQVRAVLLCLLGTTSRRMHSARLSAGTRCVATCNSARVCL